MMQPGAANVSSSQPAATSSFHDLPLDVVLHHIFPRFNFSTWVCAADVCRQWRRLARELGPPLDIPWLWISTPSLIDDSLFDLRSNPPCRPRIPPSTRSMGRAIGSHGQYILHTFRVLHDGNWFIKIVLDNPFTGQSFQLPLLRDNQGAQVHLGRLSSTPDPTSNKDFLVAVANDTSLFICRRGDQDWVSLPELPNIEDLLFHKDNLYCVYDEGQIISFNVPLLPNIVLTQNFDNPERNVGSENHCLVVSCGELLFVTYHEPDLHYSVQSLEQKAPLLVDVDNLGDKMLFVGEGCSTSGINVSEMAEEFFTKNCICFFDYARTNMDGVSIGKYNLGTEEVSFKFIVCRPNTMCLSFRPLWINP